MMRAVWSFWTKPYLSHFRDMWFSERHHLFAWVISVETARKHYPVTELMTDDEGARLLVDGLKLPFACVNTDLNALAGHDPGWWALGKLYAYRAQLGPFVHIDSDVFLWNRLPAEVESAAVFSQNPEYFIPGESYYMPEHFEQVAGWLPPEWAWFRCSGLEQYAECCGVVGGQRADFLRYYANLAIQLIEHPANQPGWRSFDDKIGNTVLFEQYLLSACLAYHCGRGGSRFEHMRVAHLFDSAEDAFDPDVARRVGYTHLIAGAKADPNMAARLERRVQRDYPEYYERSERLAARAVT